jgi:hypothetical protein
VIESAVKDINAAEKFNLTGGGIIFEFTMPGGGRNSYGFSQNSSLLSVLSVLARSDLYRTINVARALVAPSSRALGVIAACRTVIEAERRLVEKKVEPDQNKTDKKQSVKP